MPLVARANGLWRGPEPDELRSLTFCEAKVIDLARVYVSVKRVFLTSFPFQDVAHRASRLRLQPRLEDTLTAATRTFVQGHSR